jgi:hypothetical protein
MLSISLEEINLLAFYYETSVRLVRWFLAFPLQGHAFNYAVFWFAFACSLTFQCMNIRYESKCIVPSIFCVCKKNINNSSCIYTIGLCVLHLVEVWVIFACENITTVE